MRRSLLAVVSGLLMAADAPDPALDVFREGVAALFLSGVCVGHVATLVETMRTPFRRRERAWLLVTLADGERMRIQEDYAPWTYVSDLRQGRRVWDEGGPDGQVSYTARWLEGAARADGWARWGIKEKIGAYL